MVFRPKLNTHGEHELELAANWAEPENQAELVPGPAPDKIENLKFFSQKIEPKPLLVHHVKGQPAASTYVREKGCVTCDTNRDTPWKVHVNMHAMFVKSVAFKTEENKIWKLSLIQCLKIQNMSYQGTSGTNNKYLILVSFKELTSVRRAQYLIYGRV